MVGATGTALHLLDPSLPESYATCATAPTDLGIKKTGPAQFAPGGKLSYTIQVWNYGPVATSNIPVADQLPDNVSLDGPPTCTASGTATCGSISNVGKAWVMTTGALPVNNSAGDPAVAPTQGSYLSYTFTVTAAADALSIENTATITTQDLNPDNNTSTLVSQSTAQASVQKTAPAKVAVGQEFDYTQSVTNGLPTAIASAVVADQLPPNIKALSASGASCSGLPSAPGALLSCTLATPVPANGSGQFTIRAVATGLGVATNYASTSPSGSSDPGTPGPDCNATPYSCTSAKTLAEAPPVSIRKSFSPTIISTEGASLLTITVSNANSSVDLTGLRLTDTLPAGLHTQGDMAGNTCEGTLSSDGSTLTLTGGILAAGAECQLKWLVASATVGSYLNTIPAGNVRSAEGASNTTPATATLEVRAPADIDTAKTLLSINGQTPQPNQRLRAGDKLDYQITVTNAGGTAGSTKLTETVPHGAKYIGVNEGWTATCSTEASTCEQTVSIPAKGSTVVHFTMEVVRPVLKSTIVNTVASDTGDCDNCSYSSPVVSADMAATGATVQNVKVGEDVSVVTTCTNLGTDYGVNATCTVSGAPANATTVCTPAQPVAQFQVGAVFRCTTTFKAEAPGTVILTTTAKSDTRDARPSNNAANSAVNITEATPPVEPTPTPTPVPVDSRWMLLLTALAVALLAARQKLRPS